MYGRLQDAWLEMCTTYLEMVGDLSNRSSKEASIGQEWEGEESLAGILGQLDKEGGDKKSDPKRETPEAEEVEDTSCEVEKREISSSSFGKTIEETTDEASDEAAENTNVLSPLHGESVEHCNEAKNEDDLDRGTQEKPVIEDIVDAKHVPEEDDTPTDGNSTKDQIKLVVEKLALEGSDKGEMGQVPVVLGKGYQAEDTTNKDEEEVDIMSENDKVVGANVEKDQNGCDLDNIKEEDVEKQSKDTSGDDVIEEKRASTAYVENCDIEDTDVPNDEARQNEKENNSVEHIIEDKNESSSIAAEAESESENIVREKDEPEAGVTDPPFSFSDFARQPNRPDSPNMSEGSDPEEGGGGDNNKETSEQEEKKSEESQKENVDGGSPAKKEVKINNDTDNCSISESKKYIYFLRSEIFNVFKLNFLGYYPIILNQFLKLF